MFDLVILLLYSQSEEISEYMNKASWSRKFLEVSFITTGG